MSQPPRLPPQPFAAAPAAVLLALFLAGCGLSTPRSTETLPAPGVEDAPIAAEGPGVGPEKEDVSALPEEGGPAPGPSTFLSPPSLPEGDGDGRDEEVLPWPERMLASFSLREKVGQLMMPWVLGDFAPEGSDSHERMLRYIEDQGIGGVIMSVGSPTEIAAKLNDLQRHSRIPLLVAADLETGAGFRMRGAVQMPGTIELGGATDFPSLMAVGATGDPHLAYEMGRITAIEARAVGIQVPFAPVLDVNNNPDNPIINVRSFGEDPGRVSDMGVAFISGLQENGAIATGKHFPGHGDTETDSHMALPVIRHNRARMDSVELRPFQAAIDAGMRGIMTAHISVPSLNGGNGDPSTLSAKVLTTVLRDEMGFDGIVFTDAMDMSAISRGRTAAEAAVRAIEAGADVILMPASVEAAIDGIVKAVRSGRIPESRIDESVMRLLRIKSGLGLDRQRTVSLDDVPNLVGIPEHALVANEIAQRSITVLKNERDLIPLLGTPTARVLSVSFRRASDVLAGRYFNRRMRDTYPRLRTVDLDADSDEGDYKVLLRLAREQALVVVSTYVTAVSYSGSVAIPQGLTAFIAELKRLGLPHIVVSFGNPYLVTGFPDVQSYVLAWNGSEASQRAAARALLGEFEITGRVPTGIPPLFLMGDGIIIKPRERSAGER